MTIKIIGVLNEEITIGGGGGEGAVESVAGRTGNVVLVKGDITDLNETDYISSTLPEDYVVVGDASGVATALPKNQLQIPVWFEGHAGEDLAAADPVYRFDTHASGKPILKKSRADDPATMPAIGLSSADYTNGDDMFVANAGPLQGINTSTYGSGPVFVAPTGGLTTTQPVWPNDIQKVAVVLRDHHSAGSAIIQGAGRVNALPNVEQGKMWVGDANGVPQPVDAVSASDVNWILSSSEFSAPVIAYPSASVETDSTGTLEPYILSGTTPVVTWAVTSGTLPSEFSLDADTGIISYTTNATPSSGTFGITASTPAGNSTEHSVEWAIEAAQGAAEFLNTLNPYAGVRVTTSNSISSQYLLKQAFHGKLTGTSTGLIAEDSAHPIYAADNGDSTWNYLVYIQGYSYQMFFKNSTTDPSTLADSLSTDMTSSGLTYDLVAPVSDSVTLDGVNYPSDRSDIHYISQLKYINFGQDATLDNFATDAASWSYGFKLEQDWLPDGLGRCMFTRAGRNWLAVAVGHSDTYSEMIIGNGSSRTYDSSEVSSVSGGFSAGDFVKVTFDGSVIRFYVNGTLHYDFTSATSYMDGSSANSLDLTFGNGVESNTIPTSESYGHGKWQGLISRLWIANGTVETTDDNGTTFPAGATHSWLLNETAGKSFAANLGTVVGTGVAS